MSNSLNKSLSASIVVLSLLIIIVVGVFFYITREDSVINSGDKGEAGKISPPREDLIDTDEILSGGVPKDGIPSIDDPKFINLEEAEQILSDNSRGLGISLNGVDKFYPFRVLVWHEIVNDNFGDQPVLVTYCPLCATAIAFEREVEGMAIEFGVSGRLWQSNLLMYDRQANSDNESLWSQILGQAVVGPHAGDQLAVVKSSIIDFRDWKDAHPDTIVLSEDTGVSRRYGQDPYEGYYTDSTVGFGASFDDDRLHPKDLILGVEIEGEHKAYSLVAMDRASSFKDGFSDVVLTIEKNEFDEISIIDAEGNEVPYIASFWFSWLAVHPDTELFIQN